MVAGVLGREAQLSKNVVCMLKTVLLAGWEFALRMIPASLLRLVHFAFREVPDHGGAVYERTRGRLHPVTSKTTFQLRGTYYDHIVECHAPCQAILVMS
jgi:hypothetical protein